MNPISSFTFTSCPTQCTFVDSQAYMQQYANQAHYPQCGNNTGSELKPFSTPSTIHINPRICPPRNIYVNRALYSSQQSQSLVTTLPQKKIERVYYNPKFFRGSPAFTNTVPSSLHAASMPAKQESKIHINPNFFRKDVKSTACEHLSENIPTFQDLSAFEKPTVSSAIHINPMFLKDMASESIENSNPVINIERNSDHSNNPRQKYVTKYKIVQKKVSPALISDPSIFRKANLKKINQTPVRKGKFKIVKGKCLKYVSQGVANQKYSFINKYSLKRISPKAKILVNSTSKNYPSSHRNTNPKYKHILINKTKNNALFNYKKSVLQQKIEARRRVKSSINQNSSFRSKYKYVRSSQDSLRLSKPNQKHFQSKDFFRGNSSNDIEGVKSSNGFSTEFKFLSRMKLVRKSVLQKQIESRMHVRKVMSNSNISPRIVYQKKIVDKVSKYKIVRSLNATPARKSPVSNKLTSSNKSAVKKKRSLLKFSSDKYRSEKLKKMAILTKKLRKNNQPCPFYHRFGRCKGKDRGTCPKLHDSKYISICKRFLKGECKDEKCLLSHDIRPEKMPTCHHYLAGLCKRVDCPYLHIKLNPKAPICRAFLQGFCADVFNCTKRHEFICPTFAEKGCCPRGKSCSLPHRTASTGTKLLEPDEFPLLSRKRKQKPRDKKVSTTNVSLHSEQPKGVQQSVQGSEENKPKEFKRYFLAIPPVDDPSESSNDSIDEEPTETS